MASSLKNLKLPNLQSICDAKFVKDQIKFKTKKEMIIFLQQPENEGDLEFLQCLDLKVKEKNDYFRQEIKDYFQTIQEKVKIYREEVKKQEKINKKKAEELKEQEIFERLLKRKALEDERKAILERNGLKKSESESESETPPQIPPKTKSIPKPKAKPKINLKVKEPQPPPPPIQLELKDYFRIAQSLVEENIFQVYTDTGEPVEVQCLMMEDETIKMILKTE